MNVSHQAKAAEAVGVGQGTETPEMLGGNLRTTPPTIEDLDEFPVGLRRNSARCLKRRSLVTKEVW